VAGDGGGMDARDAACAKKGYVQHGYSLRFKDQDRP
jgi:hypothetical protein